MFGTRETVRHGQTLIETMVALSVATMAFLGIATLLSKSFFYHRVISDELTATYLASEGVELAKNIIDYDVYSGNAWGTCLPTGDYELDYTSNCNNLQTYNAQVPLWFNPTTERYSYHETGGSATDFVRLVRVTVQGDEIDVKSIVTWSTGPITSESVNLEDVFYDWQK